MNVEHASETIQAALDASRDGMEALAAEYGADPVTEATRILERYATTETTLKRPKAGEWVEGTIESTGDPWIEVPARVFYTGVHRGQKWTTKDLDSVAASFREPGENGRRVPVQLDHSMGQRETVGHVRKVWRVGNDLYAILRVVGSEAVRAVKNELWSTVSISVYHLDDGSHELCEISFTPFPQLEGASTRFHQEDPMEKPTPAPAPEAAVQTPAPAVTSVSSFDAEAFKASLRAEFSAKTEKMQAELQAERAERQKLTGVIRFTQLQGKVEKFCQAGLTTPAMRDSELSLLETFSDEQLEKFEAYKASCPKLVSFDVLGEANVEKPSAATVTEEDVLAEATRLATMYKGA